MASFIKKIFFGEKDEHAHSQFVRFGKGIFSGRAALNFTKGNKIKLSGSSEYAYDFVLFAAELGAHFTGIVLSKEPLEGLQGKKKAGLFEYHFSGNEDAVREIAGKTYALLLDGEGDVLLKMKKKLPKPGKSREAKIDDKFCVLEIGLEHEGKVRDWFLWDVDGKKIKVSHEYHITDIIFPQGEKDPELLRLHAKRKGKIVRKTEVDGKISQEERSFEV